MAEEKKNISTNDFTKGGLITDLDSAFIGRTSYSYARNMDKATHEGNVGTRTNSMANELCVELPYPFLSSISLNNGKYIILSGDGINSEIGTLDEKTCIYTKNINAKCLAFQACKPISGEGRILDNGDIVIYYREFNKPPKRINLSKIPYKYIINDDKCESKEPTKEVDCDELNQFPNISIPCISLNENSFGNLPNGTYSAVIAYVVDGVTYSDYYGITNRIQLYSKSSLNGFTVSLEGLDRDFDQYSLVIIQDANTAKIAYNLGNYSTSQSVVSIDDFTRVPTINLSDLVIQKRVWESAGNISANSNYLILSDLTRPATLNYQPQAMSIKVEYVVDQVTEDYYENNPKNIGYYRDENYEFFIEWLSDKGTYSNRFHIPGPKKDPIWSELAAGDDVYEIDPLYQQTDTIPIVERWEVENTAEKPIYSNLPFINNRRQFATGLTGYHQSSENYDDNQELYGEDACTPIRHHRMPDEAKVPRYMRVDGRMYLNILGVRFKEIKYPVDIKGKPIPGFVGYRIIRSDRMGGNKTVIARGISTNLKSYVDKQNKKEIWYSNYPYNDLRPDSYLSLTQTVFKNGKETLFKPLEGAFQDKFAFYTPHALFLPTYKMGNEFKFETEEIANIEGYFEETEGHPKNKLLTQFAFWIAITLGTIEATLIATGKTCIANKKDRILGKDAGQVFTQEETYCIKDAEDVIGLNPIKIIKDAISSGNTGILGLIRKIKAIITAIAVSGLKTVSFGFNVIKYAEQILETIRNFTGNIQYAYQYNSHGLFDKQIAIKKDYKRRFVIEQPERITSNLHTVNGTILNNFGKQNFVLVQVNKSVEFPTTEDNSRQTISDFGICKDLTQKANSTASVFYCTSKVKNINQYGRVGSAPYVLASDCIEYIKFDIEQPDAEFKSGTIFGGDCVITKLAIQTKQPIFRQNLAVEIGNELSPNYPDGTEYDYRLYRNIGYPRYWMDSTAYNFSNVISKTVINYSKFSRTTTSKYNLDCKFLDKENVFRVDNSRFYTSVNGVMEFYVESDYNISFREKTTRPFYSKNNTNLSDIFKPQRLFFEEEFKIDPSFTRLQTSEFFSLQLPSSFKNKDNDNLRNQNAVIYSLPSFNSQSVDNWRYFLPNNYFTFSKSDYGNLVAVHKIDQDRLLYLFDRSSPFVSPGRDELQTLDGRKIQVGDGGLFARDPREVMPTDVNYGSCQSKFAFSANQFGYFYPSRNHGRFFNFQKSLEDVARKGMHYWHSKYMPIQLYDYFPNYNLEENPLCEVGYLVAFDSTYGVVYLTKRDYIPKEEFQDSITYEDGFKFNGISISLKSEYFEDISWTIGYDAESEEYLSWYDWHPDWVIQTETHFMTVKDNGIWKHNDRCDLSCNFYGVDYPFQFELIDSDQQIINTRRNLEYQMEVYHYKNKCRDKFHVLNQNFDTLVVHNSEQMSPALSLTINPQTKYGSNEFPRKIGNKWEVLFSKEENKYRINQFWDSVKNRGEFNNQELYLWNNHSSGYKRTQNLNSLDLNKTEKERKKFRHAYTRFLFSKNISGINKFIVKFFNFQKQESNR